MPRKKKPAEPLTYQNVDSAKPPMPPATGPQQIIPDVQQYQGTYSAGKNFFKNPDEAYQTSPENAYRMFWDLDIRQPLESRILATCQNPWSIEPEDANDQEQLERAEEVKWLIEQIPGFLKMMTTLSFATWFGKYGVQLEYGWTMRKGKKYLAVKRWSPVHGDSIYWKWDEPDRVSVLITPGGPEGTRQFPPDKLQPTDIGLSYVLDDREREAFVIHTYQHLANDWHKMLKAGGVKGIGLRDTVYATWYLKNETMGLLQEYMERVGLGITIYMYEAGNPQSEAAVKAIAESQTSNTVILWPYTPGDKTLGGAGVQRIEPSAVGMSNFMSIIKDYYGSQLKRMIVGQDLTSESHDTGLGSNLGSIHENTFMRIVKFDAVNMSETLTRELVERIHRYNYPDDDFKLTFKINVDRPDPKEYLEAARQFFDMGGALDEDEVRSTLGFTKPEPGAAVLKNGGQPLPGDDLPDPAPGLVLSQDQPDEVPATAV